jgi:hypothetical protein
MGECGERGSFEQGLWFEYIAGTISEKIVKG